VLCLVTIFILIIIIIIIVQLVVMLLCQHVNNKEFSLLSICQGNLSQIVGGIRLTQGKEIHAVP